MSHKKSAKNVTPDADLAKWCAALATQATADEVPPGWLRSADLAKLLGKSESHTFKMLAVAAREGRCETASFRVQRGSRVLPHKHYKLK